LGRLFLAVMVLFSCFVAGCSDRAATGSGDWAYAFVRWQGESYRVTEENVPAAEIGARLGEVEHFSDDENFSASGRSIWSNAYPAGTEFFEISGHSSNDAIAVKVEKNAGTAYVKLVRK